jgi:predicted dehydrogenase
MHALDLPGLQQLLSSAKYTPQSAIVVGARTQRQGTGPFIAAGLAAAGVQVSGIVGTSEASVQSAREGLQRDWQLAPQGFTSLERAIADLQPDAVAVCSPWQFHAEQLRATASAGRHCLVEKPLAWPATAAQVDSLVSDFEQRGLLLQMVDQWPTTLPAFAELHGGLPQTVDSFTMRLSPISIGSDMITDSAPHFVGMLQALLGPGDCEGVRIASETAGDGEQALRLDCSYRHASGGCEASLRLQTQRARPRPAWYQVNELRADREVELPQYQQYLACGTQRVALPDPLHQVTAQFARAMTHGTATAGEKLRAAHRNLEQLATAWE